MKALRWTDKDIQFLKDNYSKISTKEIGKMLNRSASAIQKKTKNIGLVFKKSKYKTCGMCKKSLLKHKDNFFTKVYKQKNKDGSIFKYVCYRSICKKCHVIDTRNKKQKERCKELNCTIEEYSSIWKKSRGFNNFKYKYLKDVDPAIRPYLVKRINKGYVFTTIDQYKKDRTHNRSMGRRKYDYDVIGAVTIKHRNIMYSKILTDSVVCNRMGLKLEDVSKEMIETKRLIIKLGQELNKIK